MRSKSEKAEEVRTYFIEIDDFITRYTERIVNGLVRNLNKSEHKKIHDGPGWIYIFRVNKHLIKVGHTNNLLKRLSTYNTGRDNDIQMLATYESKNRMAEDCVKSFSEAKRYSKRRELYEVDENIIKRVMKVCSEVGDQKLYYNEKWKIKTDGNYFVLFTSKKL